MKNNGKQVAASRLTEAAEAMRNIRSMPAAKWEERYPTFHAAVSNGNLRPTSADPWNSFLAGMSIELNLRIAEFLTAA